MSLYNSTVVYVVLPPDTPEPGLISILNSALLVLFPVEHPNWTGVGADTVNAGLSSTSTVWFVTHPLAPSTSIVYLPSGTLTKELVLGFQVPWLGSKAGKPTLVNL